MSAERARELVEILANRREEADTTAVRVERRIHICWWAALGFGALAFVVGLLAEPISTVIGTTIKPWVVSLLTALAAGCQLIRQKTAWRAVSDEFYRHRDTVTTYLNRLKFECSDPPTTAEVAAISKLYNDERGRLGQRLSAINKLRDEQDKVSGRSPQAHQGHDQAARTGDQPAAR